MFEVLSLFHLYEICVLILAAMEPIQENSLLSSPPNQQLLSVDEELWRMAEERAQEILCIIQPNVISEVNRKDIIEFLQRLIGGYYGAEVRYFDSIFIFVTFYRRSGVCI